ncbi:hypothetical protein [Mesobacillus thioparans]|uniref:hypothetical protein n=1 Tax=Mesobacillus thioparans TaxID=370439 RepID=UPI0039EE2D45
MSKIKIDVDDIMNLNPQVKSVFSRVTNLESSILSVRASIDHKILSRTNLNGKFNKAGAKFDSLEQKIRGLEVFVNQSMDSYWNAEKYVLRKSKETLKVKSKRQHNESWQYFKENFWEATKASMGGYAFYAAMKNLLKLADNVEFKLFKDNGRVFVKLVNEGYQPSSYMAIRNLLMEKLGGQAGDWKKGYINRLVNSGIALYDSFNDDINNNAAFRQARHKYSNTSFSDLNKYIERLGQNKVKVWGKTFGESFVDNTKALWEDFNFKGFREAAGNVKLSKALGVAGTLIMVGENMKDAYEEKSLKKFVVDTGVDATLGIGSVAAGAAFGSLFIPPVGTVVGAAAGAGINLAMNWKFDILGGKSVTDASKEFVSDSVDKIEGTVKDSLNKIGNTLGEIFG